MSRVADFLQQTKANGEAKSKQMAGIELSVWDNQHEHELKEHFGFNDKSLQKRKTELQKKAG